ncbi:hypothetical protein WR25_23951 [Diploscapter pachys]|uniref:Calcineurin-like phosphoesterase domain-containing protein n=1 Tax=Diploscapter pachys TaxID=2018661 RepID=A0A2A2LA52_9BILA|nr:hypothetical protein WR25_23951 [Diploscapter pachys]
MPGNAPPFVPKTPVQSGKPTLRVLHLTDLHLDMYYTPGLEADCDTPQCCRPQDTPNEVNAGNAASGTTKGIKQPAGYWGTVGNCDAPYYLFTNMLDHIVATNGKLDYIVVTGDLMSHDVWNYNNVSHMAFIKNISDSLRSYFPGVPVLQIMGNHEGIPIDNVAPHFTPNQWHMDWLYGSMLKSWRDGIPDDQNATMIYRGSYVNKLYPGMRVIALNNVYGDSNNFWLYVNQSDPDGTLTWLVQQLLDAEKAGDKVQIIAHINGGNGESLEGWDINYYNAVNRVIFSAPSLTTYSSSFPAYRIYTIDGNYPGSSFSVIDWEDWFFNLTLNNANPTNPQWQQLFGSVLKEYGLPSAIPDEWNKLIDRMKTDDATFNKYYINHHRRNQYDGVEPCTSGCRNGLLCTCREFHHSKGKLCPDLAVEPKEKPKKYVPTRLEIRRKVYEYKLKKHDSETCPL